MRLPLPDPINPGGIHLMMGIANRHVRSLTASAVLAGLAALAGCAGGSGGASSSPAAATAGGATGLTSGPGVVEVPVAPAAPSQAPTGNGVMIADFENGIPSMM